MNPKIESLGEIKTEREGVVLRLLTLDDAQELYEAMQESREEIKSLLSTPMCSLALMM